MEFTGLQGWRLPLCADHDQQMNEVQEAPGKAVEIGDTDADGRFNPGIIQEPDQPRHFLPQPFGENTRAVRAGTWQDEDKLIATRSGDDITGPGFVTEYPGLVLRYRITGSGGSFLIAVFPTGYWWLVARTALLPPLASADRLNYRFLPAVPLVKFIAKWAGCSRAYLQRRGEVAAG